MIDNSLSFNLKVSRFMAFPFDERAGEARFRDTRYTTSEHT